jgi:hypothetical protein
MSLNNIAIFGDSFCSLNSQSELSWPKELARLTNAKITNFGLPATSILWSYKQLINVVEQYDWVIWCVSSIQRITINLPVEPWSVHYNGPGCWKNYKSPPVIDLLKIVDDFFLKVDFYEDLNLLYNTLITSTLKQYPNLTVIPCFNQPLNVENYLGKISQLEVESLTNIPYNQVWEKYQDCRPCHLTPENNQILAKSIVNQYGKKIIEVDINDFNFSHSKNFDNYFKKC